jgi:anaerobic selenocysteine-containing dehydrogenase
MRACEISVVIDVVMTETAAEADYVLPAASQYEKVETTFFGLSFPENWICLRPPVLDPLGDSLPEPEIHTRLAHELGALDGIDLAALRTAAEQSDAAFAQAFMAAALADPKVGGWLLLPYGSPVEPSNTPITCARSSIPERNRTRF